MAARRGAVAPGTKDPGATPTAETPGAAPSVAASVTTSTTAAPATTPHPLATATTAAPSVIAVQPAPPRPADTSGLSPLLVGLIVLSIVALLAALTLAVSRWAAWEPEWALDAQHAFGEAADRVSLSWAEFRDWLRLAR